MTNSSSSEPFASMPDLPYLPLLERCTYMKHLKQIHAHTIITGFARFSFVISRIMAFCAVSDMGDVGFARLIFDQIEKPTIFNWNTMIRGYSKSNNPKMGVHFYLQMLSEGVLPNKHTFPFVIRACTGLGSLFLGKSIHIQIVKHGFESDLYVNSALIKLYSSCGDIEYARQVFDRMSFRNLVIYSSLVSGYCACGHVDEAREVFNEMSERNEVVWSAMISGYAQNGCFQEAIDLFHELRETDMVPTRATLVSVLSSCAGIGALEEGKWVHSYVDRKGFGYGLELGTALVDMYTKCGCIESACFVFDGMHKKDVLAWSAMIGGLAAHGLSMHAFELFANMERSGVKPNEVTFIGILGACNHSGLVEQGWYYFDLMRRVYKISPTIEHYGCMIDLLGRAGQFIDAEELIESMPMKPDGVIWGALLGACMIHGNSELGERVGKHLIELEPKHSGRYVLLGNLYAAEGKWEGVVDMRKMMRKRGVTIIPGHSFIEICGIAHRFLVDDKSHPQSNEIYQMLDQLTKELISPRFENHNALRIHESLSI
ncbi:hypothetical protein AMTRI_Chr06g199880 [Amborella trichopoda]